MFIVVSALNVELAVISVVDGILVVMWVVSLVVPSSVSVGLIIVERGSDVVVVVVSVVGNMVREV